MLGACGTVAEMRSDNITQDDEFIYASLDATCKELRQINEANKIYSDAVNEQLQQIRNGTKW